MFKLEDGIEFVAEYFVRDQGSINNFDIPHEKDAKVFSCSITEPELDVTSVAAINQFYKYDFEAFGYRTINTDLDKRKVTTLTEVRNPEAEEKVKAIREWRETTISTLYHKTQQELRLIDPQIFQTTIAMNKYEHSGKLDHEENQQSAESLYDEILAKLTHSLVKLNHSLVKLKPLESPKQRIKSSETSSLIQLANQCRYRARKISSAKINTKNKK